MAEVQTVGKTAVIVATIAESKEVTVIEDVATAVTVAFAVAVAQTRIILVDEAATVLEADDVVVDEIVTVLVAALVVELEATAEFKAIASAKVIDNGAMRADGWDESVAAAKSTTIDCFQTMSFSDLIAQITATSRVSMAALVAKFARN